LRPSAILFVIICASSEVIAQNGTADGVRALVRGDYASAARILKPLAETDRDPDPIAQFFLATIYDRGNGVPPDQIRACGLDLKAAAVPNALAPQAAALAEKLMTPLCLTARDTTMCG
jgi:TPR repeat protein